MNVRFTLFLSACIGALYAEHTPPPLPTLNLNTPELQIDWPEWAKRPSDTGFIPKNPHLCACNLQSCWYEAIELTRPPDPVPLLAAGYLNATHVEVWQLVRAVDTAVASDLWKNSNHRGIAISASTTLSDEAEITRWFQLLADALTAADSSKFRLYYFEGGLHGREDTVTKLRFVPDLVITSHGGEQVRVEIDFEAHNALLHVGEEWGVYDLAGPSLHILRQAMDAATSERP